MTKAEKYWVFGMIYMLAAAAINGETRLDTYAAVFFVIIGAVCLLISAVSAFWPKAK